MCLTCSIPFSYNKIVFASNGIKFFKRQYSSWIMLFEQSSILNQQKCYCYTLEQTETKIKTIELIFFPNVFSLQLMNPQIIIIAEHKEKTDVISLSTKLEKQFFYETTLLFKFR
ncbi:unnamed protein product [Paramecium sonneborni]|uniref:Uncharacterized protein n=1 Tax=Paramecium sonneborni TaxID=65129 RepID=A0A8S1P159_9CILI|nr:unnamed protein product [Paramecium sonneborni]